MTSPGPSAQILGILDAYFSVVPSRNTFGRTIQYPPKAVQRNRLMGKWFYRGNLADLGTVLPVYARSLVLDPSPSPSAAARSLSSNVRIFSSGISFWRVLAAAKCHKSVPRRGHASAKPLNLS